MRQPISKRTRFEIFKRDNFTCQYCGTRPPDVVLELDHIHPVSLGGDSDEMNLITSCDVCNRGKGAKVLGERIIRPDADIEFLRSQQEIAEAHRYIKAREQNVALQSKVIEWLSYTWKQQLGHLQPPDQATWIRWLKFAGPEQIETAICKLATRYNRISGFHLSASATHYISGILRRMVEEEGDAD